MGHSGKKKSGKRKRSGGGRRHEASVASDHDVQSKPSSSSLATLETPALDLSDAGVLGIETPAASLEKIEPRPSIKKAHGNTDKIAEIIRDHLVHKKGIITYNLLRNFRPVLLLLRGCGLFPIQFIQDRNKEWTFQSSLISKSGIAFMIVTFVILSTFMVGCFNATLIISDIVLLETDKSKLAEIERLNGRILLSRNVMITIVLFMALIQSVVTILLMWFRRKKFAYLFSDWVESLLLLQIDMTHGVFLRALVIVVILLTILITYVILSCTHVCSSAIGGPLVVGMMTLRNVLPYNWLSTKSKILRFLVQAWGLPITFLIFVTSKAPLLFFVHKCELLKNGFVAWNARLFSATLQTESDQASEQSEEAQTEEDRTTYGILYEDYFHLLKLKEDMDKLFGGIVELFFCLESISICLELYLFVRALKYGYERNDAANSGLYFIRPNDWIIGLILFGMSIVFLQIVSMSAINLGEEIQSGLEIIRRSTMLGKKKEEELFFMASLFTNYTEYNYGTNALTGAGLFHFDRDTHGHMQTLIIAFFLILYQFQPRMDYRVYGNKAGYTHETVGRLLSKIELNLPENHWLNYTQK